MSFLLTGLSLLAAAQAAVTSVEVKGGCSKLPGYSSSTGIAGPWIFTADHCHKIDSSNGACSIEGFGSTSQNFGDDRGYMGIVTENTMAKTPIRCNGHTDAFESRVEYKGSVGWVPVNVTDMPYSAQLMWGLGEYSRPLQAYELYEDDKKMDGFYLGAHNVTTWALSDVSSGGDPAYWQMRLLGPNSADPTTGKPLYDGETIKSYIRIDGIQV
ncbi:hypothetical protein N7492_004515 [Penicillium capsulatum]|uniref:Uncharacterized protein n=1 Tax=Penicillium capsulatum TaxID=69766 RepID=A0A9W9IBP8_9EURO|nr:hypothetical protein N7492_004515 [Penicillium capsulatum]KAJ6136365.1 hypothetical protein N7512_001525 [Penicillium capsulatum]